MLEQEIINHKKPAEDINKDLEDYLGHSEIRFATKDSETGYTIMRGDKPAAALSEGEKTAIALLHFLKTLEDQNFKLSDGIVVIDDPVCSMDDTLHDHPQAVKKVGSIKLDYEWDSVMLVLMDEQYDVFAIYEAGRDAIKIELERPGSVARNERGALPVPQLVFGQPRRILYASKYIFKLILRPECNFLDGDRDNLLEVSVG